MTFRNFSFDSSHVRIHELPDFPSNGTTVVSECLNVLIPVLVIRSTLLQLGSGHATRASVVIQSLTCVLRCFAAKSGRTDAVYDQYRMIWSP